MAALSKVAKPNGDCIRKDKVFLLYLTIYIIRDDLNTEFHTLWFSGVLANTTVAMTPIQCLLVKTSRLSRCFYVPFSFLQIVPLSEGQSLFFQMINRVLKVWLKMPFHKIAQ